MHPAILTFAAFSLLLGGLYDIWQAPKRRMVRALQRAESLREGRGTSPDEGVARWIAVQALNRVKPYLPGAKIEETREKLLWAGQPFGLSAEEYLFAWIAGAILTGVVLSSLVTISSGSWNVLWPGVLGVALGLVVPERLLNQRIETRTRQIQIDLPSFVHLLATSLESGLPITEAIRRVAAEAPGLLAAEMLRTVQEMAAGKPAKVAWQHLAYRTKCAELRDVVTAIIQSQELGVGIAEQLRFHMGAVRRKKQQAATERAQAASVKMKVPVILFIVAPTMVVLLGPAAFGVLRMMTGG